MDNPILISIDFYDTISPSLRIVFSIEKIHQTLEAVFRPISKQKYSA